MSARYRFGGLRTQPRTHGPDVWQFRWLEDGRPKLVIIGTVAQYPTKADAERAVEYLRSTMNADHPQQQFHPVTVGALIDKFLAEYAPKRCRKPTLRVYASLFKNHIRPRWGMEAIQRVKTGAVEDRLDSYPHSRQVKVHCKRLMHTLFSAALKWEMVEKNPVDLIRQSGKRLKTPRIITPVEFRALLGQLAEPHKTMVLTIACLGLRVSELLGLQWGDIDFLNLTLRIQRGFREGAIYPTKAEDSASTLPLDLDLADVLLHHRTRAVYRADSDFVFAGANGTPPWPDTLLSDYIKPAAVRAGIGNVGWHTFRRSYATLLHDSSASLVVQKELLRHPDVATTINVYTQAVPSSLRDAASKAVATLWKNRLG